MQAIEQESDATRAAVLAAADDAVGAAAGARQRRRRRAIAWPPSASGSDIEARELGAEADRAARGSTHAAARSSPTRAAALERGRRGARGRRSAAWRSSAPIARARRRRRSARGERELGGRGRAPALARGARSQPRHVRRRRPASAGAKPATRPCAARRRRRSPESSARTSARSTRCSATCCSTCSSIAPADVDRRARAAGASERRPLRVPRARRGAGRGAGRRRRWSCRQGAQRARRASCARPGRTRAAIARLHRPRARSSTRSTRRAALARTVSVPVAAMTGEVFRGAWLVEGGSRQDARGILETRAEMLSLRDDVAGAARRASTRCGRESPRWTRPSPTAEAALAALVDRQHDQEKAIVGLEAQVGAGRRRARAGAAPARTSSRPSAAAPTKRSARPSSAAKNPSAAIALHETQQRDAEGRLGGVAVAAAGGARRRRGASAARDRERGRSRRR